MNIHARTGLTTQQMALRRARIVDAARRAEAQRDLAQMFEGVTDELVDDESDATEEGGE